MKTKRCNKCGGVRPLSEFYRDRTHNDGFRSECKSCNNKRKDNYNKMIKGVISKMYSHQKQSSKRRGNIPPKYTKKQLHNFALNSDEFISLYNNWVKSGYDKWMIPTFDRLDDMKGYSFDNFNKWMKWVDNSNKAHLQQVLGINNRRSKAVIGTNKTTDIVVEFFSITNAHRVLGIARSDISSCCMGKSKTAGGYTWKYKDK